jgi:serine protease Do
LLQGKLQEAVVIKVYRLRVLIVIVLLVAFALSSVALASTSTTVVKLWVGNNIMTIGSVRQPIDSEGTKPVIVEGRTLVPIRAVIEAFDGSVAWDATERKVTVTLGENALDLWIGKSTATLNGTTLPVDAANPRVIPVIMSGRTMLPLRFVSESLGIDVQYEATTKMITLTYTVDTTPPAPPAPLLVSPADGNKFMNELPRLSWLPATGADASRVQILSSGVEVHTKSNLTGADYVVPAGVLADGTFTWRVSVHNEGGWGPWSEARSFVLSSAALPAAPTLLTPLDQSVVSTGPVTLTWTAVTDASTYRVRVLHGTDQTHAATDIAGTSYVVPSGTLAVGIYSWQVGTNAGGTWSDWSAASSFTVQALAPSAPKLLTPADQSVLDSASIVLTWESVAGADSYRIQILRDGTEVHAANGLSTTAYPVPAGVLSSGSYSWQAAAHGPGGWSTWSDAFFFEARAELTVTDIAKYVDRMVLVKVQGFEGGEAFSASGSGFFISSDGRIVTNYHVIDFALSGTVTTNDGREYPITSILGYDKDLDLAIIKIAGTGFPWCILGDSANVVVGQPVVAIGSPLGLQNTVSEGIVSKIWSDAIQTTAAISHGSSGGALFDRYGEVIGVTSGGFMEGENLGVAVPINALKSVDTMSKSYTLRQIYDTEHPGAATLQPPVLIDPANDAVVSTPTPTFSWKAVPGATKYEIQIWAAPSGPPYVADTVVTGTSYTISPGVLASGTRYGWTVYAGNGSDWSTYATIPGSTYVPAFTVQAPAVVLTPPSLLQPTEDLSIFPTSVGHTTTFKWSPASGAVSYTLWIGSGLSGSESTNVYTRATSATSYSIATSTLVAGRLYTWAIGATDSSGNTVWSIDRHLSIVDVFAAMLVYPANYSTISTNPTMIWLPYSDATDYTLFLQEQSTDLSWTQILKEDIYGTQYALPSSTLTQGVSYRWQVAAWSGYFALSVSDYSYFSVSP